ncbi:MAG: tetratricopeptide repeat protein [Bacteroidales bacterium]|nr:tetratricopeptide repeat protein [Bacteroidales bacterium]
MKKQLRLSVTTTIPVVSFIFLFLLVPCRLSFSLPLNRQIEKEISGMPDDTAKVNLLLKLGEHYCSLENDKALMYLQEAFTIATSLNYTEGIGKSLLWQGRVYYYKDDYPLSNNYLDKAEAMLKTTDESNALAFTYFAKAVNSRIRGDYIHALEMFKTIGYLCF